MSIKIIDNKRVDMTQDEYDLYQKILESYNSLHQKGSDLFIDLFESNDQGIILFLKPPAKKRTTFEVIVFLQNLMLAQHIRQMYVQVEDLASQFKDKIKEIDAKLAELKK